MEPQKEEELTLRQVKANRWIILPLLAIVVGGVEMRMTLATAMDKIDVHERNGLPETNTKIAVIQAQAGRVEDRLKSLEQGQAEIQKSVAGQAATQQAVLDELRALRAELRPTR